MKPEKRRPVPMKVQRDVALNLCRDLMRKLGMVEVDAKVEFDLDHDPALELRSFDPETGRHIPPQHEPACLIWRTREAHRVKTTGRAGTSKAAMVNGDAQRIAKNRLRQKKRTEREAKAAALAAQEPPAGRLKPKPKSRWPRRPMRFSGK